MPAAWDMRWQRLPPDFPWTEQRPMLEAEGVRFRKNGCVDLTRSGWKEVL